MPGTTDVTPSDLVIPSVACGVSVSESVAVTVVASEAEAVTVLARVPVAEDRMEATTV